MRQTERHGSASGRPSQPRERVISLPPPPARTAASRPAPRRPRWRASRSSSFRRSSTLPARPSSIACGYLSRRPRGRDLEHRPFRRAHPQALVVAQLPPVDLPDLVNADSPAAIAPSINDRYLHLHREHAPEPPYRRSGVVTQICALSTYQQRRLLTGQRGQLAIDERVDAMEHGPQTTAAHPMGDRAPAAPERDQLLVPDDGALPAGQRRNPCIPPPLHLGHNPELEDRASANSGI